MTEPSDEYLVEVLEQLIAQLTDRIVAQLSAASHLEGDHLHAALLEEKRLSRARRSLEKASTLLRNSSVHEDSFD